MQFQVNASEFEQFQVNASEFEQFKSIQVNSSSFKSTLVISSSFKPIQVISSKKNKSLPNFQVVFEVVANIPLPPNMFLWVLVWVEVRTCPCKH